jgi:hypothetical protein
MSKLLQSEIQTLKASIITLNAELNRTDARSTRYAETWLRLMNLKELYVAALERAINSKQKDVA